MIFAQKSVKQFLQKIKKIFDPLSIIASKVFQNWAIVTTFEKLLGEKPIDPETVRAGNLAKSQLARLKSTT